MTYIDTSKLIHQLTDLQEGRVTDPGSVSAIAGDALTVVSNLMTYHFQTEVEYRLEDIPPYEGYVPTTEDVERVTEALCDASETILNGDLLDSLIAEALETEASA